MAVVRVASLSRPGLAGACRASTHRANTVGVACGTLVIGVIGVVCCVVCGSVNRSSQWSQSAVRSFVVMLTPEPLL